MDKNKNIETSNKMSDQDKNKIVSLILIILISFLSSFLYLNDFSYSEKLIISIPVFTLLFTFYAYAYGLKRIIAKIIFILLIIASIMVLLSIWYIYEFAKGMKSN